MFCINRYALVQCLSHEFRFRRSRSRNLQPKLLKQTLHQGISAIRGGYQLTITHLCQKANAPRPITADFKIRN